MLEVANGVEEGGGEGGGEKKLCRGEKPLAPNVERTMREYIVQSIIRADVMIYNVYTGGKRVKQERTSEIRIVEIPRLCAH